MDGEFTNLVVWQKAHELTIMIYICTKKFPKEEIYSLVNQMRRAAVSVESNIAESHGRNGLRDVIRFLIEARGSIYEVQTQILVARDVEYLSNIESEKLLESYSQLAKQLNSYINYKRNLVSK